MNKFIKLDWIMMAAVFLLIAIGMLALYSVSFQNPQSDLLNFKKQFVSVIIGFLLMFLLSFYDYRVLNSFSTKLYFGGLIILIMVILWGSTIRGTTGWIGFGSFHIQPVEIIKLIMIIFLASFLSKKKTQLALATRTFVSVVLVLLPVFLILKQPDMGSAMIIVGFWAIMLTLSDVNKKNLIALALLGLVVVFSGQFFLRDYQKERVVNFISPERDPLGSGYNVLQSIIAVGSGGMFGKGLGHGSQSQLNFLPEKHTDFIFAAIAEELGFLGAIVVFILFGVLFWRIKEAAKFSRDNFGYLLAVGIASMFFLQFLVNIGMNIGVMPVAGVPLPFLSYGGSSLVMALASMGIIQNIYMHRIQLHSR